MLSRRSEILPLSHTWHHRRAAGQNPFDVLYVESNYADREGARAKLAFDTGATLSLPDIVSELIGSAVGGRLSATDLTRILATAEFYVALTVPASKFSSLRIAPGTKAFYALKSVRPFPIEQIHDDRVTWLLPESANVFSTIGPAHVRGAPLLTRLRDATFDWSTVRLLSLVSDSRFYAAMTIDLGDRLPPRIRFDYSGVAVLRDALAAHRDALVVIIGQRDRDELVVLDATKRAIFRIPAESLAALAVEAGVNVAIFCCDSIGSRVGMPSNGEADAIGVLERLALARRAGALAAGTLTWLDFLRHITLCEPYLSLVFDEPFEEGLQHGSSVLVPHVSIPARIFRRDPGSAELVPTGSRLVLALRRRDVEQPIAKRWIQALRQIWTTAAAFGRGWRGPALNGVESAKASDGLLDSLIDAFADELGLDRSDVTSRSTLASLGVDEYDVLGLQYKIGERFGVTLPAERFEPHVTVGELADAVRRRP